MLSPSRHLSSCKTTPCQQGRTHSSLTWRLGFIFLLVLNNSRFWCVIFSHMCSELIFWLGRCAAERASQHLMTLFHVHSQHGWRHTFLVTLSTLNEILNTIQMLLLPVGPNAILGPPNSGLVRAVWVSTGKPEQLRISFIQYYFWPCLGTKMIPFSASLISLDF